MPDKTVKFHLDQIRNSRAFDHGQSLWHNEIKRMLKLVFQQLDALSAQRSTVGQNIEINDRRPPIDSSSTYRQFSRPTISPLTMALFGTYGAGKSSLLQTFSHWIATDQWQYVEGVDQSVYDNYKGRMCSLDLVVPNTTNSDDGFIYAFLAAALEKDLRFHERQNGSYQGAAVPLSPVQQKFHEVSKHLQAIDEKAPLHENDPLGISLERLDRHSSTFLLKEALYKFVDALADELVGSSKSSVIILPVDDADMDPKGLLSALDTYNAFLQHPRLVPIFAFTGRIAEELLRNHFEKKLILRGNDDREYERLREASTNLTIAENLAVQYMSKLFPVRNRIKLSLASERARNDAVYIEPGVGKNAPSDIRVKDLLLSSSCLLFGTSEWPLLPGIRAPMESAMLRRQIQIIDAMRAAGVDRYLKKDNTPHVLDLDVGWAETFDRATWALLNIHRDVLKEYRLDLDDLYSWTPVGLRQAILVSVLQRDVDHRRRLLHHWQYRTTDRRSQMLSLLAASAFRPNMTPVLPQRKEGDCAPQDHFSVQEGAVWFIGLWLGFYLPQVLARHRRNSDNTVDSVTGIGWTLRGGPPRAISEAIRATPNATQEYTIPTGMLFLDPQKFADKADESVKSESHGHPLMNLMIGIWCYHGIENGTCWAAISLWRGLGLIGQILEEDIRLWREHLPTETISGGGAAHHDRETAEGQREKHHRSILEQHVTTILWRHLRNG